MLIVDSGTALFREEFLDRGVTKARANLLNLFVHKFKNTAEIYNLPALFVNQVYNSPDQLFGKNKWIHFGGNIVAHTNSYRIRLEKVGEGVNKRRATLVKSPMKGMDEALYKITDKGIEDVE
jgi:RecA/RadA recombinase